MLGYVFLSNIGNALIIISAIYFYYEYGLPDWATALLIFFAVGTWTIAWHNKKYDTYIEKKTDLIYEIEKLVSRLNIYLDYELREKREEAEQRYRQRRYGGYQ